jgi:adenylate kinase
MRNVIILMGCPGAGKGTQGRVLAQRLAVPKISTGDMLREEASRDTALSQVIAAQMNSGGLVGDDVVNAAVKERIRRPDCRSGFVLDGYPRTVQQAEFLRQTLQAADRVTVVDIQVSCGQLLQRLTTRRGCSSCGAIYNLMTAPPLRKNLCDQCGAELVHREDDRDEVVEERFRSYIEQTEPVITYYRLNGAYCSINGGVSVDEVSREIDAIIAGLLYPVIPQIA